MIYLKHFGEWYKFNDYVVQGNCKKSRHLELRETVNIQSIVGSCLHSEWIRGSRGNREILQPPRNVRPNNKCTTHISLSNISSLLKHKWANFFKVIPKDVANHCGTTFHEVKIFLLEKFVVHVPVISSQANVHALQSGNHGGIQNIRYYFTAWCVLQLYSM